MAQKRDCQHTWREMRTRANLSSAEISSQMYLAKLPNPTSAMVWLFVFVAVIVVDDAMALNCEQKQKKLGVRSKHDLDCPMLDDVERWGVPACSCLSGVSNKYLANFVVINRRFNI